MAAHDGLAKSFNLAAQSYELRAGGSTRAVGKRILPWMNIPSRAKVLDNACGTGVMAFEILKVHPDAQISAVDVALPMLEGFAELAKAAGIADNVSIERMDAMDLKGFEDELFDASVMNFGIFFLRDPEKAAAETFRTLKKDATAVITSWKAVGTTSVLAEAQKAVQPVKPWQGMPAFEKWRYAETLEKVMRDGGFQTVEIKEIDVVFSGLTEGQDALYEAVLANVTTLLGDSWSQDEMERLPAALKRVLAIKDAAWCIELDGVRGIKCTAYVAIAKKT